MQHRTSSPTLYIANFLHVQSPTALNCMKTENAETYQHQKPIASIIFCHYKQFSQICQLIHTSLVVN